MPCHDVCCQHLVHCKWSPFKFIIRWTNKWRHFVCQVLYLALEKRYNFSIDDLDVVANGYSHFRSYLQYEEGKYILVKSFIIYDHYCLSLAFFIFHRLVISPLN